MPTQFQPLPDRLLPSSVVQATLICQFFLLFCASASGASYQATKLQLPPVWGFYDAARLSPDGRAGGYVRVSIDAPPIDVAVVWTPDGAPGVMPVPMPYRKAYVHNFGADGRAVGNFVVNSDDNGSPTYWTSAGMTPLRHFGVGGAATAANDSMIAGETGDPTVTSYFPRATLWDIATETPQVVTGLTETGTVIRSINSSSTYVGTSVVLSGPQSGRLGGFFGRDGSASVMDYSGFNITRAQDINDGGWIVGTHRPTGATVDRAYRAKVFSDEIYDLGLLPGFPGAAAQAINNDGTIVGSALAGTIVRALIWQPGDTQPTDFNTLVNLPGETLVACHDINNAGQILARGNNGYYIFTPLVPEPAAAAALVMGGIALLRRRRPRGTGKAPGAGAVVGVA